MKWSISSWKRLGFGLDKVNEAELSTLKKIFDTSTLYFSVRFIKTNFSVGYYKNLEYRLIKTIKKTPDNETKKNIENILLKLRTYNWQNISSDTLEDHHTPQSSNDLFQNEDLPDIQINKKECIRTLTGADLVKFNIALKENKTTWNEFNMIEYDLNGTLDRNYMKCNDNTIKHISRRPLYLMFDKQIKGSSKKALAQDTDYIELSLINVQSDKEIKKLKLFNSLSIDKLRKYGSLCQSFFVNENTMISTNGGQNLANILNTNYGSAFTLRQFKNVITDICNMQKEHIFMTDIKLKNLVCHDIQMENVLLIDTDSIACEGYDIDITITAIFTTLDLYSAYDSSVKKEIDFSNLEFKHKEDRLNWQQSLANISSYALFLTMIEATTGFISQQLKENEKNQHEFKNILFNEITFNPPIGEQSKFDLNVKYRNERTNIWINKHVKTQYQNEIHSFSKEPHLQKGLIDWENILKFPHRSPVFSRVQERKGSIDSRDSDA